MSRQVLPFRHRLVSALLALLVLATSVGLTAERHRCRISGRSTVALLLPSLAQQPGAPAKSDRLCGPQRLTLAKHRPAAAGCCDISHVQHKLDARADTGNAAHWLPGPSLALPPALLPTTAWSGLGVAAPLAASVAVGTAANSSPPGVPKAGRVLLTRHCTLVV